MRERIKTFGVANFIIFSRRIMRRVCYIGDEILLARTWSILVLLDITPSATSDSYAFTAIKLELLSLSCDHRTIFIDIIGT